MAVNRPAIDTLKDEILKAKSAGVAALYCDNLISYIDQIIASPDNTPSEGEVAHFQARALRQMQQLRMAHETRMEGFKAVIGYGQSAIKTMVVVNGGASVALLAFIGHLAANDVANVLHFVGPLVPFGVGALFGGLASGGAYLSQWCYEAGWLKRGGAFNLATVAVGAGAYVAFAWGLWASVSAFSTFLSI